MVNKSNYSLTDYDRCYQAVFWREKMAECVWAFALVEEEEE